MYQNTIYLNKKPGETSASVNVCDELELPLLENKKAETYCFAVFEEGRTGPILCWTSIGFYGTAAAGNAVLTRTLPLAATRQT